MSDAKERTQQLLEQLTKKYHYSDSTMVLYQKLTEFISTIVQDDICMKRKSHENRLHDLLCNFSFAYVPIPMEEQLQHHGSLVNHKRMIGQGSNGRIFKSGVFEGNPIVTKTKKRWSEHTIYDMFVNFVIINSFLLQQQFENYLIPSYGIFLCSTNDDGTEICVPTSKQEQMFLVQKQVIGLTLSKYLHYMTLQRYKSMLKELSTVLIVFEESVYQLYHSDLHAGNIIMAIGNDRTEHPVLLDFELSSFTVIDDSNPTPYRFRLNSVENTYCKNDYIKCGAYDFILLLAHTTAFDNEQLEEYCMNGIQLLCRDLWEDDHVPLRITKEVLADQENRWIYQLLYTIESQLPDETRTIVHAHNIDVLGRMTYRHCSQLLQLL
jgi:hypothetical protein